MFYGGGLWGYFNQSCLDNLFSKSDFSIEQLLDEDNIINDVKMNQNKFADYMIKNPQYLQDMIKYVINMPSEDDSDKQKHKYPFISSELLGIQIPKIQEFFFSLQEEEQNQNSDLETSEDKSVDKSTDEKKSDQVSNNDELKNEPHDDKVNEESTKDSNDKKEGSESAEKTSEDTQNKEGEEKNEQTPEKSENAQDEEVNEKNDDQDHEKSDKKPQRIQGQDLLNTLFKFLDSEQELDSTSAGYFNKVVMHLISQREGYRLKIKQNALNILFSLEAYLKYFFQQKFWKYLKSNPKVIDNMLNHFYLKSVSKIVFFLISSDGIDLDPDIFIDQRIDMVQRLHKKFRESQDHEVLLNIQEILVQVNSNSFRPQNFEVKRQLYILDHINILLESIENHKESFSQASLILSNYLDHYRQTIYNDNSNEDTENYCSDGLNFGRKNDEAIAKEFPLEYIQSKTSNLIKALMEENFNIEVPRHETQYGSTVQPYGLNRVKLLHLILCLLKTENQSVNDAMVENGFFSYLLIQNIFYINLQKNLITKHEWNNILHNQIEQIYNESFKIAMKNEKVRDAIIKDAKFLDFIVQNGKVLKTKPGSSRKEITKGYVCMLVSFANQIEEQKERLGWLQEAVNNTQDWDDFVNDSLKKTNDLHKRDLGNEDPRKRKESEDSIPNSDLSIKEIYMKFISMYQNKNDDDNKNSNDDSENDSGDKNESITIESPETKPEESDNLLQPSPQIKNIFEIKKFKILYFKKS